MPDTASRSDTLERRLLLASPSTAEYYPLTETSRWEYAVAEGGGGGGAETLNVKVARGARRIGKQEASLVVYAEVDDRIQTFQNINSKGKLLIHGGTFEEGELFLQPPIVIPARLQPGTVKRSGGNIDFEYEGFDGDGSYTSTVRIGKDRRITVPAGTFSAVRVRVDLSFQAQEEILFGEGPEAGGRVTHVMYLARGLGVVRAEQSYEIEADFIVDEESRSGSSVQQLRSYRIAPAEGDRARPVFATDADEKTSRKPRGELDVFV